LSLLPCLLTLVGGLAFAQAPQAGSPRVPRQRTLVLAEDSAGSAYEVRVAAGVLSSVVLEAPLALALAKPPPWARRFRLAELGEHIIRLEPLEDLQPEERLLLQVPLRMGDSLTPVTFVLLSHPSEVDTHLTMGLPPPSRGLGPRPVETESPGGRMKRLERAVPSGEHSSLEWEGGTYLRAVRGILLDVELRNRDLAPWIPGGVRLLRTDGTPVPVHQVEWSPERLGPGQRGRVQVRAGVPSWPPGETLRLELSDEHGARTLFLSGLEG
jgi:hypothetical protein